MEGSFSSADYVLMPWDDNTIITVFQDGNVNKTYLRWELIQKQLKTSNISNVEDLVNVIKSYNVSFDKNRQQRRTSWKFPVLFKYFEQLHQLEREKFFKRDGILSTIRCLSFHLKEFVPRLKLLKTGTRSSVNLHQLEIASILCSAFFCIFPKGKTDCPSINFSTLFEGPVGGSPLNFYTEKLKCFIHYFKRIHERRPSGYVSFYRLNIPDHKFPRWDKTAARLDELIVNDEEKIEDKDGFLQMDFANRYIGGGVLGKGCVQEEIRFLISPELIAARLFTECFNDNESVFIVGAERYCCYTGYSNTFAFAGNYQDLTSYDDKNRKKTYLIILDALYFQYSSDQYRESKLLRELKKAYVGFKALDEFKNLPLATGNWGCGAFKGDPQLKFLLQLMASSQACRSMWYSTFGDGSLKHQIMNIYILLKNKAVNVGKLYRIIRLYKRERQPHQALFDFVREALERSQEGELSSKIPFYSKSSTSTSNHLTCTSESKARCTSAEEQSGFKLTLTPSAENGKPINQWRKQLNQYSEAVDKQILENIKDINTEIPFPSTSSFNFSPTRLKSISPQELQTTSDVTKDKNYCSDKELRQEQSSIKGKNLMKKHLNIEMEIDECPNRNFSSNTGDFDPCVSWKSESPVEVPSLIDLIMRQNEIDCKIFKEVGTVQPKVASKSCVKYSRSLFSDEMVMVHENAEEKLTTSDLKVETSFSKVNQFPTFKCMNKTGSAMLYKSNKKKLIQRKITDSFRPK